MPGAVPGLDIGLYLAKKVGVRPLLGGEAFGAERAHLSVEALYVDCCEFLLRSRRGTDGSNPVPSSAESSANLISSR
jgi:hypothetical protein